MDELICSLALFILCVSQQGNLTRKFKSHMYLFPREDSSLGVVPRYMKEENEMKRAEPQAALLVVSSLLLLFVISPLFCVGFPSFLLVVSPVLLVVVPPLPSLLLLLLLSCSPTPHRRRCLALLLLVILSSCSSSSCRPAILLLFVLSVLVVFFFLLPVVLPSCSLSSCLSSSSFRLVPRLVFPVLVSSSLSSSRLPCPHPHPPCPPPRLAYPPPLLLVFVSFPLFVVSLPPPFISSTSFPRPFCPPHPPRLSSSSSSCPPSSPLCYRGWSVVRRLHRAREFSLFIVIVRPRRPCHLPGHRNSSVERQAPPTSLWRGEGRDTYCNCWGVGG